MSDCLFASKEHLQSTFGNRYRRQIELIGSSERTTLPFGLTTPNHSATILVIAGHYAQRAILILATTSRSPEGCVVRSLIENCVEHCVQRHVSELLIRCCAETYSATQVRQWIGDEWIDLDLLKSYQRRNLCGLGRQFEKFLNDFSGSNESSTGESRDQVVALGPVLQSPKYRDQIERLGTGREELHPLINDFEPEYSLAAISASDQLIGWLVVSRRNRALLYNRLFVCPSFRSSGSLWAARLVAHALQQQRRREPEAAVRFHTSEGTRMANFCDRYVASECHRVESLWLARRSV